MINGGNSQTFLTIGIETIYKFIEYNNQLVRLKLLDIMGQERFRFNYTYFRNAKSILYIYSINDIESFNYIRNNLNRYLIEPIKILIGIDNDKDRIISYDEGDNLAKNFDIPFYEINVNNKNNFDKAIFKLIELYINKHNIINTNNINSLPNFFVNCTLNYSSNCKKFLKFINLNFYNVRLKNMKKYSISFLTQKYNENLIYVDGGIYIVNLWNINDYYNLKNELNNDIPNIAKMILGLNSKNKRTIDKKEIMNLAKMFNIAYFEINLLNSEGFEIAFQYLIMEMISYSCRRKNNFRNKEMLSQGKTNFKNTEMCSLSKNNCTNKNIDIEKSKNTHKKKDKCEIY